MPTWLCGLLVAALASAGVTSILMRRQAGSLGIGLGLLTQAGALLFLVVGRASTDPAGQVMAMLALGILPIALMLTSTSRQADKPCDKVKPPACRGDPQP